MSDPYHRARRVWRQRLRELLAIFRRRNDTVLCEPELPSDAEQDRTVTLLRRRGGA